MRIHSTKRAAKRAGIHWVTLIRWVEAGKIRPSQSIKFNKQTHWGWTDRDVERVRKYKAANYRKGRGRKKKTKKA